jgi:hypothetical protein
LAANSGTFNANTGIGENALHADTTSPNNTAVGQSALANVTANPPSCCNSALGEAALANDTTGSSNSAMGGQALIGNTTGSLNSAFGVNALFSNTTASDNAALGNGALFSNTTGGNNSALGLSALSSNTTAGSNTAVGKDALKLNTGGSNAALGDSALNSNTTGASNTALGQGAGNNLTTGNNNIDINNGGTTGESNTTRIGTQGTQTKAFLAGVRGVTTGVADAVPVLVDSSGQLGVTSSSRRFKQDINPLGSAADGVMKLRPVTFRYKRSMVKGADPLQFGLIAEQVAKVFPHLVSYGSHGKPTAIAYQQLPALLLAEMQKQQRQIDWLQSRNARVDRLQAEVTWLMHHR